MPVGSTDGIDEAVESGDTDTITSHCHVCTAPPAVGPRVEAVDSRRVLRRVRGIVSTAHHVDLTVHLYTIHRRRQTHKHTVVTGSNLFNIQGRWAFSVAIICNSLPDFTGTW